MIQELMDLQDLTIDDITKTLSELITEKSEALNTLNIAVNEHVRLKNEYIVNSNSLRLKPDEIKEELGLNKVPTEKQQQAYIDDQLQDLVQELRISEENVNSWKREVDLLNDKISLEKYRVNLFKEMFTQ
ncbi:MAG: hypothetical protein IJG19_06570 [Methanobrevibacter sp.]|nr:hypothetical protein [Methanobrevibacter sp.]